MLPYFWHGLSAGIFSRKSDIAKIYRGKFSNLFPQGSFGSLLSQATISGRLQQHQVLSQHALSLPPP